MDDAAITWVLDTFPYGLYTVTIHWNGEDHAMLASWVTQASFVPAMVAISIENESRMLPMIREARSFGMNVLSQKQKRLAEKLGRTSFQAAQKLKGVALKPGPRFRVPILADGLGWLECRLIGTLPAGDHTLVLGEVVEAGRERDGEPLTPETAGTRYGS